MRSHFGTSYCVNFDVDVFLVPLLNRKWFRNVSEYFYIETFEYYKGVNEYEIQVGNV